MIVNSGLAITTNRLRGGGTEPRFAHWGTGTTAPVGTNTALEAPTAEVRVDGTSTQQTTTTTNDTYRVIAILVAAGTRAITEAGLFDALTAGNLFFRGVFPALNLVANDSVQLTFNTVYARP